MASLDLGDRVIWLGALDAEGNAKPGGWARNGKGRLLDYEPNRLHFTGGERQDPKAATRGPAVLIILDGGDERAEKKYDVWVAPMSGAVIPDPDWKAPS